MIMKSFLTTIHAVITGVVASLLLPQGHYIYKSEQSFGAAFSMGKNKND